MVLRQSIKELYAKVDLIINGKTVLSYSETLCGPGLSKLIFCGKKKGEHLYYEGPITLGIKEIPQGDYTITARLTNEDRATVACADFTVKNYLEMKQTQMEVVFNVFTTEDEIIYQKRLAAN